MHDIGANAAKVLYTDFNSQQTLKLKMPLYLLSFIVYYYYFNLLIFLQLFVNMQLSTIAAAVLELLQQHLQQQL